LKESFAISGAHFFAYFLWARPKKVSQPRQGMKQGMDQKHKTPKKKTLRGTALLCRCASPRAAGNALDQASTDVDTHQRGAHIPVLG
jgi:hypothetical protein